MDIETAIGENEPDDYILSPSDHADLYKEKLPKLSELLRDPEIQHLTDEYLQSDKKAISAQNEFKRYSLYARWGAFFTTLFSTTLLLSGWLNTHESVSELVARTVLTCSTILTIAFSAASATFIMIIKNRKLLENWMGERSEAEEYRLSYFNRLAESPLLSTAQDHLQVLEYFRRYQIDIQLSYYDVRSRQLSKTANKSSNMIAILAGVVLLINGIVSSFGLDWTSLAALAIIVQAISNNVSNRELTDQNLRNAERYERTRKLLAKLKSRIGKVRTTITKGDLTVLKTYVHAIQEPLSAENKQWLKSMKSSSLAIDELEKRLKAADPSEDPEGNGG